MKTRTQPVALVLLVSALALGLQAFPSSASASADTSAFEIEGIWQGALSVAGTELRVVFTVSLGEEGIPTATLDSPDQGATDIPVSEVTVESGDVRMEVGSILGLFEGKMMEDGSAIVGQWTQSGMSLPLVLERVDEAPEVHRPQEPAQPYPYLEEEVLYENTESGGTLAGTLTLPDSVGRIPAVLLVSGSGPQDRDETVFGHRPFLVLADYLTRRGIAVLRVDDRGVGGSTGDVAGATSEDFATDVLAGIEYLRGREEIDPEQIGLLGHSEGGLIVSMVAARSPDVAYIVMMAGTGITGEVILYLQAALIAEANGASAEAIGKNRVMQERIFGVLKTEKEDSVAEQRLREIMTTALTELGEEDRQAIGLVEEAIEMQLQAVLSPWFRFFLTYDPTTALVNVECPVLAINGEKDLQVPPKENLEAIEEALEAGGNEDHTVKELPGLNHLFQEAETGSPTEYGRIEETISPSALEVIGNWILAHIN